MRKGRYLNARTADKFDLYLRTVQAPSTDARLMSRWFQKVTGRAARTFREDFCGTANLSCEFVRLGPKNRAFAVDIDPAPLQWCILHNWPLLTKSQRKRLKLKRADVFKTRLPKVDLIAAFNFSYWIFKKRNVLLSYFRKAKKDLVRGGVLMMDVMGGPMNQAITKTEFNLSEFTYVWEVAGFNPINHNILFKIHFKFKDGSQIPDAFQYDCRMWTLPELQDLLAEAGFRHVQVLWENTNPRTQDGTGVFRIKSQALQDEAWLAYVVAQA